MASKYKPTSPKAGKLVKKAYSVFRCQHLRCYFKKHKGYKYYGAKGIRIEYTYDQFIGWYLNNIGDKDPNAHHVGRIDHNKNYSLTNIEIQTPSQNTKEKNTRCGNPKPPKPVLLFDKKTEVGYMFSSAKLASKTLNIDHSAICKILGNKIKQDIIKGFIVVNK